MAIYDNILLTVDLHLNHDEYTTERAVALAKAMNANLTVLHVYEEIHTYGTVKPEKVMQVEKELTQQARVALSDLLSGYNIDENQVILAMGNPKEVIIEQAQKIGADLIIVGGHTHHGLTGMLGRTASAVIERATCDVLAIHAH
ncbi:MAG: universal stress protein [Proteobacteria bacterium]|nr:universal stress protein [Pseudomonadota bacterium]